MGTRYRKVKAYLRDPNLKAPRGDASEIKLPKDALYYMAGKHNCEK